MELFEVIGIQRKTGTFQGKPFDNTVFSVTRPADVEKGEVGTIARIVKVKTHLLTKVPAIGDTVSPIYDQFQNCVGFI